MVKRIRKNLENTFQDLIFDEENHKYFYKGVSLPSVTGKTKEYEQEVDWDKIAYYSSLSWNRKNPEEPKSPEQIRWEWLEKGRKAAETGTRVHLFAEEFDRAPTCSLEEGVEEFYNSNRHPIVIKELRMFTDNLAGTADLILLNEKSGNLIVADWKTNENIYKNYKEKKLQYPFEDLLECPINKHAIQLSYYKSIIEEKTSYKVEDTWVIWLSNKESKDFIRKGNNYTIISVPDLTKKVSERRRTSDLADFF